MKKILLLTLIISSFLGCNKEENNAPSNRLPDITTVGANTFGCKINGELWIPKVEGINVDEIKADLYTPREEITIIGRKITENGEISQQMILHKSFIEEDTFNLNNQGPKIAGFNCDAHYVDSLEFSQIIFHKFDKENEIISGTFEFTAVREDEDCQLEKIHVTEGRFDLKLSVF